MQSFNNGPSPQPQQNMSSPAPLLRPPIPGARPGRRGPPQLGLSIPPSPNARPVTNGASDGIPTLNAPQPRQMPKLSVVTPMGSNNAPHEGRNPRALPPLHIGPGLSASGSSDASAHSRSGSFGEVQANGSASSYHAALGFPGLQKATDPISAISQGGSEGAPSMERANSSQPLPDLDAMAAEKGRPSRRCCVESSERTRNDRGKRQLGRRCWWRSHEMHTERRKNNICPEGMHHHVFQLLFD